eukprot:360997-Chlamydomonas_euryale.AAC.1
MPEPSPDRSPCLRPGAMAATAAAVAPRRPERRDCRAEGVLLTATLKAARRSEARARAATACGRRKATDLAAPELPPTVPTCPRRRQCGLRSAARRAHSNNSVDLALRVESAVGAAAAARWTPSAADGCGYARRRCAQRCGCNTVEKGEVHTPAD